MPVHYNPNLFPTRNDGNLQSFRGGYRGGRGGHGQHGRRREQEDKPKHKYEVPDCAPWILVKTKLGRRFVHNPETNESLWRFPKEVMQGVVEFDRRERERRERHERGDPSDDEVKAAAETSGPRIAGDAEVSEEEYEEVEVTDNEDEEEEEEEEDGASPKRRRTEEGPVEFNEDDIAWQLQAMGQFEADDVDGEGFEAETWDNEEGGLEEEDSTALFRDMLEDHHISPYTPWETIIENEAILVDDRYTVFTSMKARKEAFAAWSTEKIQTLKDQRLKQEKKDPRIPYMAFMQKHATPKLYWPEFKRKYRKEPEMKDSKISDKDREKWYREHINRLKQPTSSLKSDLTELLRSVPISALNRSSSLDALPTQLLSDIRFISLAPQVRDPLVETWISTLPEPPEATEMTEDEQSEASKRRKERERREKALADREQRVSDQKRRQRQELAQGRARLREEEMELERATKVGRGGLKSHLGLVDEDDAQDAKASRDVAETADA